MNKRILISVSAILLLVCHSTKTKAQLTVSSAPTITQLVQNILLGSGVSASNITYSGSTTARGSFTCAGACNVGIANGILLTSGNITTAIGPNNNPSAGLDNSAGSDPDLNGLHPTGTNPQDAAVIEFDFMVATDSVRFNYVWGSEEYHEFVGSGCNDYFGFFINGPGFVGKKNIALIPGTNIPISINTVNNGNTYSGPCSNCGNFFDNTGGTTVQYEGLTTVLTASTQVCPCEVYHIKLAVQDFCDGGYDSGVFLEGNSFESFGVIPIIIPVGQYTQVADTIYICPGDSVQMAVNACRSTLWSTGDTTNSIWVTQPGGYFTAITNPPCFAFTNVLYVQYVNSAAAITPSGPTSFCPGDSVVLSATPGVSYLWSNGATSQNITVFGAGSYQCTVSFGGNCVGTSNTVNTTLLAGLTLNVAASGPLTFCQGSNVTLTASSPSVLWSTGAVTQSITVNSSGTYTVTPTAAGFCPSPTSAVVVVNTNPSVTIAGNNTICQGLSSNLSTTVPFSQYNWSGGQTTASISANTAGSYTVTVSDVNGCTATNTFNLTVNASPVPVISGTFAFCQGVNSVLSTTLPYTNYSWSTGVSTSTTNVSLASTYSVTVTDANGCTGSSSQLITVYTPPLPSISGVTAICQGANANITASPAGMNYLWSNGSTNNSIQPSVAATYTVTVTDGNGCSGTANQVVSVNNNPTPAITGNLSACQGLSSTLGISSPFNSYAWSNGATTSTISVSTTGNYSVIVTDANGCTGNTSVLFNSLPFTNAVITGPVGFCTGNNATIDAGAGYTNYAWSNGNSGQQLNVTNGGAYTVTVTSPNGCTGSSSYNITAWTLPTAQIAGVATICQGANANITASPAGMNYLWSNGSTNNSIQPNTAGTFTVTVTDGNGCTGTANQVVSVNNNPTPAITGNLSACQGLSSTLGISSPFNAYAWSNGATTSTISVSTTGNYSVIVTDANGCTGNTSVLFNSLPFTNAVITGPVGFCTGNNATIDAGAGYTNYAWSNGNSGQQLNVTNGGAYTVTVTSPNGCTGSSSYNITAWTLPTAQITGVTAICQGLSANLIAGPAGINYQWSTGSNASSIQPNTSGIYTLTVTDNNGCTNSITQNVTVNSNPTPSISGTFTVCQGDQGLLDVGNTPGMTYLWSTGANGSSIQPTTAGPYSVLVTDANGCTGTATQSLLVNALPTPTISGDPDFCTGDNVTLNSVGTYVNYQWSNGVNTAQNLITAGGNYVLTVTDNNGCSGNTNFTVTENPLPQPLLPTNTDLCDGNNTTLNPGNFTSYVWSTGSVSSSIQASSTGIFVVTVTDQNGCVNSTTVNVVVHLNPVPSILGQNEICDGKTTVLSLNSNYSQYLWSTGLSTNTQTVSAAGSYSVVVTDAFGCTGSTSFSVLVNPLPLVNITGDLDKCSGESTTLSTTPGQGTYSWTNGSTDPSITVTAGGIYTVTVTTNKGCTKSLGVTFNEHPIPTAAYEPESNITCEEIRVKFQNKSINEAGSTYNWTFGDGGTSTDRSPSHVYAAPGEYNTYMQVISPYGCKDDTSQLVEVVTPPLPEAKFSQSTQLVSIFNSEVSFSNSSINSVKYRWNFGDGQTSSEDNPTHIFDKVGTNKIKLIAYNIAECFDEYEANIEVAPFFIPSAFSPNDDGKNDVFFDGTPVLNVTSFDMQIFNRWGQNIYTTDSFFRPWDGYMSNGDPSPVGLYTYKIKITSIKGKYFEFTGSFSLIR